MSLGPDSISGLEPAANSANLSRAARRRIGGRPQVERFNPVNGQSSGTLRSIDPDNSRHANS
jgi:hypothetical protein